MAKDNPSVKTGDVIKIWRRAYGGQGKDYVVAGRIPGTPPDNPALVIFNKNHLRLDGNLSKKAKFFVIQAHKIKTTIGHVKIDDLLPRWADGKLKETIIKL